MTAAYPKVLLVSADGIDAESGTGITLRNLFEDWPVERLAQVQLTAKREESTIPQAQYPPSAIPIDRLARFAVGRSRPTWGSGASPIAGVPLAPGASRAAWAHANLRAALDLSLILPSRRIINFAKEFEPDLIYSLLGSSRVIRIATRLSTQLCVPLVPHFMDDWPASLYTSGELAGHARQRLVRHLDIALERTPVALCISDAMVREYGTRFDIRCESFVNPVRGASADPKAERRGGPLDLVYVGGLHLGRWDVLVRLAEALVEEGVEGRLVIHAPDGPQRRKSIPAHLAGFLTVADPLPQAAVASRLTAADVLVHVESFDSATAQYTRLSLSTKVPQYLMAARPILAVGPASQASMQVVAESGAGSVIGDSSPEAIRAGCSHFLARAEEFGAMGAAGHSYATIKFGRDAVRRRLLQVMTEASRKHYPPKPHP